MVATTRFDLELTMDSGQTPTFTWMKIGSQHYKKIGGGHEIRLGENKELQPSKGFEKQSREMLRLDDDLQGIYKKISRGNKVLQSAVAEYSGLRLTKSDAWETTVCFLVSQNNNIARIKKIVSGLHGKTGIFSPLEILEADLTPLKLGYREEYLKKTAELICENGFSLPKISKLGLIDAREALMELPGVGPKVADCILLYGFGKTNAFPTDVWVKKAMQEYYGIKSEKQIQEFAESTWGENAGFAQQLLFLKARKEL
ncbi:hypothetical protein HY993_00090 [Candidatus Micrarchaeota archaeon]|nr:hypothetical protein [Candidatus Micrarchaeota archaeon]